MSVPRRDVLTRIETGLLQDSHKVILDKVIMKFLVKKQISPVVVILAGQIIL